MQRRLQVVEHDADHASFTNACIGSTGREHQLSR
jgi:hypothetical protein